MMVTGQSGAYTDLTIDQQLPLRVQALLWFSAHTRFSHINSLSDIFYHVICLVCRVDHKKLKSGGPFVQFLMWVIIVLVDEFQGVKNRQGHHFHFEALFGDFNAFFGNTSALWASVGRALSGNHHHRASRNLNSELTALPEAMAKKALKSS